MTKVNRGRPPKKRVEDDESDEETNKSQKSVGATVDKSLREETHAILRRSAHIIATGHLVTEPMLRELSEHGLAFLAEYDKKHMASTERQWSVFELEQSPHLLKPVHDLGLPRRFLDGAVNREFPQCSSRCPRNSANSPVYWREHVLAGDLMGMNRRKVLASYGGLRSSMQEVEAILGRFGIELAGQYPEKWVPYDDRISWR